MTSPCPPGSGPIRHDGPATLMVVDDDPLFRSLVREATADRYEIDCVADGHTACRRAAERPLDIIVLDQTLPDWDAVSVLRALRGDTALAGTAVLVMASDPTAEAELLRAGADCVLDKTAFTREQIRQAVQTLRPSATPTRRRSVRRIVPVME